MPHRVIKVTLKSEPQLLSNGIAREVQMRDRETQVDKAQVGIILRHGPFWWSTGKVLMKEISHLSNKYLVVPLVFCSRSLARQPHQCKSVCAFGASSKNLPWPWKEYP